MCTWEKKQEKLRTKILSRLNEEGSNADEPMNIKLSDYSRYTSSKGLEFSLSLSLSSFLLNIPSLCLFYLHICSDEGDTSSSSSSENELNVLNSDEEGFCCQSVPLVPPSSPISPTKNRLNKRVTTKTLIHFFRQLLSFFLVRYIKCAVYFVLTRFTQLQRTKGKMSGRPTLSTLKKSHKYHRSAIDLPTAEPYLDCTSDCEDYNENRMTSAKNTFRLQLKSGQRPQTSDKATTTTTTTAIVSNELVVTSAQKSDSNFNTEPDSSKSIVEIKEKFNSVAVSELPAIKGSKRHSTWQNMKKYVVTFIFFSCDCQIITQFDFCRFRHFIWFWFGSIRFWFN